MKTAWTDPSVWTSSTRREMFGGRRASSRRPVSTRALATSSSCRRRRGRSLVFSMTVWKRPPPNL
eukprot:301968-Alexandrium_andersonii.AAC.1